MPEEDQKQECIFCKFISGDMDAKKVYEDDLLLAILDIHPASPGHTLVVPKEHQFILPLLSQESQRHLAATLPSLVKAIKKATVSTAATLFIANGGIAGQQSPHFLLHIIPREKSDMIEVFFLDKKTLFDKKKHEEVFHSLQSYLAKQSDPVPKGAIYKDKDFTLLPSQNPQSLGHCYFQLNTDFDKLTEQQSVSLFSLATMVSGAIFQMAKAKGSNMILKIGKTMDHPEGTSQLHLIMRNEEDGLSFQWKPSDPEDLDEIKSKIKGETMLLEHHMKEEKKKLLEAKHRLVDVQSAIEQAKKGE